MDGEGRQDVTTERRAQVLALLERSGGPAGDPALFGEILAGAAALLGKLKITRPLQIGARRDALVEVFADPRFAALAERFPETFLRFLAEVPVDLEGAGVLLEDALRAMPGASADGEPSKLWRGRVAGTGLGGPEPGPPVLICGFHHSGTRLLARVLERLGVFQRANTPSYEWSYIQWLNTLMLPGWNDPLAVAAFDAAEAAARIDRGMIASRLAGAGFGGGAWGHKDPRNCVTVRAWLAAYPDLKIVHIVRDPADAIGTLPAKYARFSPGGLEPLQELGFWMELWRLYVESTREAMAAAACSLEIRFEDLCRAPAAVAAKLRTGLGLEAAATGDDLEALGVNADKVGEHRRWVREGIIGPDHMDALGSLAVRYGYDRSGGP